MRSFKNNIVWITGASSGIGRALAISFAKEGALLVLTARDRDKLQEVRNICIQYTSECYLAPFDLSQTDKLKDLVNSVIAKTGRIDVLINNAGQSQRSLAVNTPFENERRLMELNFFSPVALTKLVLPRMINLNTGQIVVISSISGKFGFTMRTTYSAAKHAVQGYFESLRAELNDSNIDVTIISPGRINTNVSLNALTENGTSYNQLDAGQANGMDADKCARRIVKAIRKRKKEALVGGTELLMVYIRRWLPFLYHRIVSKIKN
nr:SDR family oxidoreductase [uncultured Carboxylicivirga sp.]